jgi:hypothetical protein
MRIRYLARLVFLFSILAMPFALTACANNGTQAMAMPDYVQAAPSRVKEAYQYAIDHPDDLAAVPCYCGCGGMGHTSNLTCFINGKTKEDTLIFEPHATGCGICVDIAQDVMRLRAEGKTLTEVRATIDATYSSFGPGTDTPLPTN